MKKQKSTKRALLMSALALVMCVSMLIGSTYAWFTDTATTSVNTIQSGTLKIDLVDAQGNSLENETLDFKKAPGAESEPILWEPGCTYELEDVYVKNMGNLALRYKVVINGLEGDAELLDVITWTIKVDGTVYDNLAAFEGRLAADEQSSGTITIIGHMDEEAGNEYQDKTITGISITVNATQLAAESDSFGNQYDKFAGYTKVSTDAELRAALANGGDIVLTDDINAADAETPNAVYVVAAGKEARIDLNGYTLTTRDGGPDNHAGIVVDDGATLVLEDSVGTGKFVSTCYGVYVQPDATFIMNGGTIYVHGNGTYDYGVTVWNGEFVMNAGTIDALFGVVASNYYKNNNETDTLCSVTIADGCTINASGWDEYGEEYAHLDVLQINEATDTVLNIPASIIPFISF